MKAVEHLFHVVSFVCLFVFNFSRSNLGLLIFPGIRGGVRFPKVSKTSRAQKPTLRAQIIFQISLKGKTLKVLF